VTASSATAFMFLVIIVLWIGGFLYAGKLVLGSLRRDGNGGP